MERILALVRQSPSGASPAEMVSALHISRSTVNRSLRALVERGDIVPKGEGSARRYFDADPLAPIKAYFDKPHTERKVARFREELLDPTHAVTMADCPFAKRKGALDRHEFAKFLVDVSCASSALEGGSYSLLDTQALVEYGEKNAGKPLEDAFLVLNHKAAFEFLHDNPSLDHILVVHELLTNDHEMEQLAASRHFLDKSRRGVVREHQDVDIAFSAYMPPFRPGTGFIRRALDALLDTARAMPDPVDAAFYLMTRIAYLQPFADGNKRVSRALCNVPLMGAGLPPISFVDFKKSDYITSMLAFYELGDERMARKCFIESYGRSVERLRPIGRAPGRRNHA